MSYTWFRAESAAVDHPKVVDLAEELKVPLAHAGGYLYRFWSWIQRYAPDGVFPARMVAQIDAYVAIGESPKPIINAMRTVGLVDGFEDEKTQLEVHDWGEKQGALVEKSKRDAKIKRQKRRARGAKTARAGRAPGTRAARVQDRTGQDTTDETVRDEQETATPVSLMPTPEDLRYLWNTTTSSPLPKVDSLGKARRKSATAALKRRSLPVWRQIFEKINALGFCRGEGSQGWVADFDWAIRPEGAKPEPAAKVLEGSYDDRGPPGRGAERALDANVGEGPITAHEVPL